ncbi:4-hydroxythreonine-4-phosphate dehydrogenase PdxA [Chelatococcus sp. GCM10030263]|uniref:4-hydroxythreonine-4-phosphate dehydrogenase PdxA n=1 Tax=Chelatococcus sp. GCM10030263 TaxID=3273387 RepID=UPI0036223A90
MENTPRIALVMGDAAGVGAELTAKLLACHDEIRNIRLIVLGDRKLLQNGARIAGVTLDLPVVETAEGLALEPGRPVLLDLQHKDADAIPVGRPTRESGAFAMRNFGAALDLGRTGAIQAICFTPFNKQAFKLAGNPYLDELHWAADRLGAAGRVSEYNRLDDLWNARVTSHIPMAEVPRQLTREAVLEAIFDTDRTLRKAGIAAPRLGIAGYNPHAGEGGLFGREEIDSIEPAIADAAAQGLAVAGPFPADTVWLRAKRGDFDAVVTMYHDQGQIALKLMGFSRGVTILAGLPVPIATPAHGTAYDIAGTGKADLGATLAAFRTAVAFAGNSPPS